jgi:MFS superfamily sulfate permease-like transporter
VDATSELFSRQKLEGIEGLKRYLLTERQDQFAAAMVHKLTAYALGRPLTFGDRSDIEQLTSRLRKQNDRLSELIHLIVSSDIFNAR